MNAPAARSAALGGPPRCVERESIVHLRSAVRFTPAGRTVGGVELPAAPRVGARRGSVAALGDLVERDADAEARSGLSVERRSTFLARSWLAATPAAPTSSSRAVKRSYCLFVVSVMTLRSISSWYTFRRSTRSLA
jgi:hypothetical protein